MPLDFEDRLVLTDLQLQNAKIADYLKTIEDHAASERDVRWLKAGITRLIEMIYESTEQGLRLTQDYNDLVSFQPSKTFSQWLAKQGAMRPDDGLCPCCSAEMDEWCRPGCLLIDPKDWR